jgi:hypothetical protein
MLSSHLPPARNPRRIAPLGLHAVPIGLFWSVWAFGKVFDSLDSAGGLVYMLLQAVLVFAMILLPERIKRHYRTEFAIEEPASSASQPSSSGWSTLAAFVIVIAIAVGIFAIGELSLPIDLLLVLCGCLFGVFGWLAGRQWHYLLLAGLMLAVSCLPISGLVTTTMYYDGATPLGISVRALPGLTLVIAGIIDYFILVMNHRRRDDATTRTLADN